MRILLLAVLLMALIVPACKNEDPQTLVAPGLTTAPVNEDKLPSAHDGAGQPTGYATEGPDRDEMALPTQKLRPPTRGDVVIQNCCLVRDAAEAFAAENGGRYPNCYSCEGPSGKSLIDYLPGGRLLWNPFLKARTEPNEGEAASPGQIGYIGLTNRNHLYTGYRISGYGPVDVIIVIERSPTSGRGEMGLPTTFEDHPSPD